MSKKTDELLQKAKSLNNPELADAIEALEFLGEEATANHQEYKDLAELVEVAESGDEGGSEDVQAEGEGDTPDSVEESDAESEGESNDESDESDDVQDLEEDASDEQDDVGEEATAKPKLKYAGIKMIGSRFYSKDDNYQTGFATADECAKHFNGE